MKKFFRSRYYAIKAIGMTLWKAWPILLILICFFIPKYVPCLLYEIPLTRLGVVYETLGILGVAVGIASKMEVGGHKLWMKILGWFKELWGNIRYLIMGPKVVNISGHASGRGNAKASASVLRAEYKMPEVSVEERLMALEAEIDATKKLITEVEKNAREKIAALEQKIDNQGKEIVEEVKKAHKDLRSAIADDYKAEFAGLFVTLIGMVFNSIPNDIIWLFTR